MMHIISNRLPITIRDGRVTHSNGGLVRLWNSHLSITDTPLPGKWFGVDVSMNHFDELDSNYQFHLEPLIISKSDYHEFYNHFSNSTLWLLLHGFSHLFKLPSEKSWAVYKSINELMASLVDSRTRPNDYVIINDYHFFYLPQLLKQRRPDLKVIFYLHTPFPLPDIFSKIPQSKLLLSSMLKADVIGVQTDIVKNNIKSCIDYFSKTHRMPELLTRANHIFTHPVSIDKHYFQEKAQLLKYQRISEKNPNTFIFLGIDRLDPIKGLVEKVQGFESFLENNPAAHGSVQLKQFVIPSREDCEIYRRYKDQLFQLIDIVNKRFGNPYWQPIDVYYYQMDENIIIQSYLSSHALFVSSLADGMNLVAYEYIACQLDSNPGVLCLSNQAGAAQYLDSALQFDPTSHIEIQHCFQTAMSLSLEDRQHRQRQSLKYIEHYTVDKWRQALISSCEVPSAQSSHC